MELQADAGTPDEVEVAICGQDRRRVRERVHRDQEIQRLHGRAAAAEKNAEVTGFLPQRVRLRKEVTTLQEGDHAATLSSRPNAPSQLRDDRATKRDLILREEVVHDLRESPRASEEIDPRRRVDEDQRRVPSRSSSRRTFPRNPRSAERFARRSISRKPSRIVGVTPLPVSFIACSSVRAGRLTVTFRIGSPTEPVCRYGKSRARIWYAYRFATSTSAASAVMWRFISASFSGSDAARSFCSPGSASRSKRRSPWS